MLATATPELVEILPGGKARLHLHAGQVKADRSKARFTFVVAGTQSGKTSWGPWWLAEEIERQGAGDYLAVTATYDLFKLKMLPEMTRVFVDLLRRWTWQASDRVLYRKSDKSRIILRSANAPEGLESATAKAAWLDECGQDAFRLESWEAVQRRLALHQGRVLGTTTPYNMGWLKIDVYDRWRNGDTDYNVIQFASTMNPQFPMEEYHRAKATLPAWKFEMFYNGNFTRPAGLIYEDFTDQHLIAPFDIPAGWPWYVGIDPGAVNTAVIWLAKNPEKNVYYLVDESLEGSLSTVQHAHKALGRAERRNVVVWALGAKSEVQQRLDWQQNGVPVIEPMVVDVEAGIDRVTSLLKTNRIYVFNTLRGVRDEFGTYSREIDDFGQPTEKIKDKETFHRMDALRYIVQHIEGGQWYMS